MLPTVFRGEGPGIREFRGLGFIGWWFTVSGLGVREFKAQGCMFVVFSLNVIAVLLLGSMFRASP